MTPIISSSRSFHVKVKTLYDIEKQLESALPKMAEAATHPKLQEGFIQHLEETKVHSKRLEEIFSLIHDTSERHTSEGIRGIIDEAMEVIGTDTPALIKDAMLADVGRSVEHFEISNYLSAIEEAKTMENDEIISLLRDTLKEEENAEKTMATALKDSLELEEELEKESD